MQAVIVARRYEKVSHSFVIQGGGSSGIFACIVHILVMELYYLGAWRGALFPGALHGCGVNI